MTKSDLKQKTRTAETIRSIRHQPDIETLCANIVATLSPISQSFTQKIIQVGNLADLFGRFGKVVGHLPEVNRIPIQHDIRGTIVAVARLPHRADIHEHLFGAQFIFAINFFGG